MRPVCGPRAGTGSMVGAVRPVCALLRLLEVSAGVWGGIVIEAGPQSSLTGPTHDWGDSRSLDRGCLTPFRTQW